LSKPTIEVVSQYLGSRVTGYIVDVTVPSLDDLLTVEGTAMRDSRDKPNDQIGECLALARALRSASDRLDKQAQGLIKHQEDMRADRKKRLLEQEVLKEPLFLDTLPPESRVPQYGDRVICDQIAGRQHFYFGSCKNPKLVQPAPPKPQRGDQVTCDEIPDRQHLYFGNCTNPKLVQ
jgi:Domain of unknown function (DUF1876)